ncbi:androgen-dependent TFPI-regulating protein-like isoform X1 [Aricia agestis]|uniref:androgen-dependent TFPI-regulating protein-like isoform X1 n=1 Tax=Aricia agestis TaxID=91739 RepID=UPI001C20919E|nr:androgen-dependent TFPI-regulating protein-like isoform X1 [Aricia agestis]XP_041988239.1 androgen-dependent TFPI-regulating protein-like isoform X1 [Aricia agestis]
MADVEGQGEGPPRTGPLRLFLRSVFHGLYLLGNLVVVGVGGFVMISRLAQGNLDERVIVMAKFSAAYFTNWNFSFQIMFLSLSVLYDMLEWLEHSGGRLAQRVRYWRDIIFCGMVVPFTMFVTHMFWTVYAIDRELVFPKVFDEVVPWWFNHCVHTNTGVMILVETLLQPRPYPTCRLIEELLYWVIAVAYAVVFYTIFFSTNLWLYAVFGVMTWWQVCLYQLYIWLSSYLVYRLQFPLNRLIHGTPGTPCEEKTLSQQEINKVMSEEDKAKDGDGTWSLKFRSIKPGFEGTRL